MSVYVEDIVHYKSRRRTTWRTKREMGERATTGPGEKQRNEDSQQKEKS